MSYPAPMDMAQAQDREANRLEFWCNSCGKAFRIDLDHYRGEYDHADCDCRCEECKEREGQFVGRRWFPGTEGAK